MTPGALLTISWFYFDFTLTLIVTPTGLN